MPGPTPQQYLEILLDHLAEAERQYAAGVPYPDKAGGNWPDKIETIKQHIAQLVEHVIYIPASPELLLPILEVVPLQLLAYHIAIRRGWRVAHS